jgi:hypothetical protein
MTTEKVRLRPGGMKGSVGMASVLSMATMPCGELQTPRFIGIPNVHLLLLYL